MSPNCSLFIEKLQGLNPAPDDYSLDASLYDLCGLLKQESKASEVIPSIFQFFEKYPTADHGSPGALVHFLESCSDYQTHLIASVQRKPTPHTAWMINRILNSNLTPEGRDFFMDLLLSILTNPKSDEVVKSEAEEFLKLQASKQDA